MGCNSGHLQLTSCLLNCPAEVSGGGWDPLPIYMRGGAERYFPGNSIIPECTFQELKILQGTNGSQGKSSRNKWKVQSHAPATRWPAPEGIPGQRAAGAENLCTCAFCSMCILARVASVFSPLLPELLGASSVIRCPTSLCPSCLCRRCPHYCAEHICNEPKPF